MNVNLTIKDVNKNNFLLFHLSYHYHLELTSFIEYEGFKEFILYDPFNYGLITNFNMLFIIIAFVNIRFSLFMMNVELLIQVFFAFIIESFKY